MRRNLQYDLGHGVTLIAIDREQQLPCLLGIGNRAIVRHLWGQERSTQISRRVAVAVAQARSPSRRRLRQYSSAIALNVLAASSRERIFSRCFSSEGSLPSAIKLRATSRRRRASLKLISGYWPRLSFFSRPWIRYLNLNSFPPLGCTSKKSPSESPILNGFSRGLALRIAISESAIFQIPLLGVALKMGATQIHSASVAPMWPPNAFGCHRMRPDIDGNREGLYRSFLRFSKTRSDNVG